MCEVKTIKKKIDGKRRKAGTQPAGTQARQHTDGAMMGRDDSSEVGIVTRE